MDENSLRYNKTHEWVSVDGDVATVGITKFAVEQLTDIVFVELPSVGKKLDVETTFGVIESVKAVSDLYAPLAGEVVAVNTPVADDPSILSKDPYGKGWMIKIRLSGPADTSSLLTKGAYDKLCAEQAH